MIPQLGQSNTNNAATTARLLTIHYEDYAHNLEATAQTLIVDFLRQEIVDELRPFRHLPLYERDHFTASELQAIARLVRHVATPATWEQIARYFENDSDNNKSDNRAANVQ